MGVEEITWYEIAPTNNPDTRAIIGRTAIGTIETTKTTRTAPDVINARVTITQMNVMVSNRDRSQLVISVV
jgi:hypothetical protein